MAIDLCGARLVEKLPAHTAILHTLNAIDDIELELSHSSKGIRLKKSNVTLASREGTVGDIQLILPEFIRYRPNNIQTNDEYGVWQFIEIVSDIDDLTRAERGMREAVMFSNRDGAPTLFYTLSFTPQYAIYAEIYGRQKMSASTTLDTAPNIPEQYGRFAAVKAALMMLDEVLLLDGADKFVPFVQSRKISLLADKQNLSHWWTVYKSNADDATSVGYSKPYDPFEATEFNDAFRTN